MCDHRAKIWRDFQLKLKSLYVIKHKDLSVFTFQDKDDKCEFPSLSLRSCRVSCLLKLHVRRNASTITHTSDDRTKELAVVVNATHFSDLLDLNCATPTINGSRTVRLQILALHKKHCFRVTPDDFEFDTAHN